MNLFQRDPAAEAAKARRQAAYEQGRRDGHNDIDDSGLMTEHGSAVRRAYDRGRRDERARRPRRRGSPVLTGVLLLAACAGAFVVYLGVSQGSFAGGGQTIDQNIANAKQNAAEASRNAADRAGDALEHAGQTVKQQNGHGDG
ncbi:MAG TPA: hypothetical protein VFE13_17745 [Caulobacteraceae bacterium]|jgi:hypothetical protein|nr:hypothetical protein [Caulobacteraceae bacterium]